MIGQKCVVSSISSISQDSCKKYSFTDCKIIANFEALALRVFLLCHPIDLKIGQKTNIKGYLISGKS